MIAGCYSLDLYCRNYMPTIGESQKECLLVDQNGLHNFPKIFAGHTEGECKRQARKLGWSFQRDNDVTCPACNGKLK